MIRLTLLLLLGLYFGLLVLGEDRGQKRHGLTLAEASPPPAPETADPAPAPPPAPKAPPAPAREASVFLPSRAVMKSAAPPAGPAQTAEIAPQPEPQPEPEAESPLPEGALYLATTGANVRSGPGRSYGVLDSLAAGEQVLVLADDNPADGWLRIRLEGDGVDGYVAERLLAPLP